MKEGDAAMPECPFKKSFMTPCVITDGPVAYCANLSDEPICVGCERTPKQTGVPAPPDFADQLAAYEAEAERQRRARRIK